MSTTSASTSPRQRAIGAASHGVARVARARRLARAAERSRRAARSHPVGAQGCRARPVRRSVGRRAGDGGGRAGQGGRHAGPPGRSLRGRVETRRRNREEPRSGLRRRDCTADAILFFDEADALFHKRSEVHDSHDRYANVEVAYLSRKLESHTGPAILATTSRTNIDTAFLRRLRSVVAFDNPLRPPKSPAEC